jgi:hypothetical protein
MTWEEAIPNVIQGPFVARESLHDVWIRCDVPQLIALSRVYVEHRTLMQFAYDCAKRVEERMGEKGKAALELVRRWLAGEAVSDESLRAARAEAEMETAAAWAEWAEWAATRAAWAASRAPSPSSSSSMLERQWQADHYRLLVRCPTEDEVIVAATEKRLTANASGTH